VPPTTAALEHQPALLDPDIHRVPHDGYQSNGLSQIGLLSSSARQPIRPTIGRLSWPKSQPAIHGPPRRASIWPTARIILPLSLIVNRISPISPAFSKRESGPGLLGGHFRRANPDWWRSGPARNQGNGRAEAICSHHTKRRSSTLRNAASPPSGDQSKVLGNRELACPGFKAT
jgi:hypothetical protein